MCPTSSSDHVSYPAPDVMLERVDLGPGVLAGFTTRTGGASVGVWRGLNLGSRVGDDPGAVATNRRALAGLLGAPVVLPRQVHGTDVLVVTGPEQEDSPADVVVTRSQELAVGVYVADCAPVLLADPVARVVAAAHAGRAGLVAGVLQAAVAAMLDQGAALPRIVAAVGPCIAAASYEVPAALRDEVAAVVPEAAGRTATGTPAVDLAAGALAVLRRCGVRAVSLDGRDTYAHPELYSHRRAVHEGASATGRSVGVVRLLPVARTAAG